MDQQAANAQDTRSPKSETWIMLKQLTKEERDAWRLRPSSELRSADERNLADEYPFGWFGILFADELAVGEVKAARYFGKEMVLWRGEDGKPRLIDAYCPHYGAHLGHGGKVHGNLIECPFHAWRMDEKGAVKEIPYARNIPPQAKRDGCVPAYHVQEANGFIHMWYHPEGEPPMWDLLIVPEFGNPDWTDFAKFRWNIYTASENVADNGVDFAHFLYVHRTKEMPTSEFKFDGYHRRTVAHVKLGTPQGTVNGTIDSEAIGSQGYVRYSGISETVQIIGSVPIDRDNTQYLYGFIQPKAEAEGPRGGLARAIIKDICSQFDEDKVILDAHRNLDRPLICDGDGPFSRQWAFRDQFYVSRRRSPPPTPIAAE